MRVLSKYSKSKNITNIENVTQQEYLQSLAKAQSEQLAPPDDYSNPFSYEEWINRNLGIIAGQESIQYNEYLKNWYKSIYTPVDVATDLRNDYIAFLKNLTLVINKEDNTNWLIDIDWTNKFEIEQAIPFFAKKLKEIAIYLVNKRDAMKKAKLKYNINGANQALEKLFYEYLLKAFTQRDYVLNVPDQDIFTTFPYLSDVKDGFQIKIQELYDDASYFDKNPALSATEYFTATTSEITGYYDSLNIAPSAYEWLFHTGFSQLCADNPLFWIVGNIVQNELPISAFESIDEKILNQYLEFKLTQKYIGESQYYVSGGYFKLWETTSEYDLIKGNNWFYWPSGEYMEEIINYNIDPLPLLSATLIDSGATGYKNYLSADKLFIRYGNTISGAWLKHNEELTTVDTMTANLITGSKNIFKFPYAGYGISGEDLDYSGPQLSNLDKSFDYLSEELQKYIKNNYWTFNTTTSSLCTILINDTNLIDNGAKASQIYNQSDRISIRDTTNIDNVHDNIPNNIYQGDMKHTWLYRMEKTDIPIAQGQNYIQWPVSRYQPKTTSLQNILTSQCAPISLSTIPISAFIGSRAGENLYDSDIIYKLDSRNGNPIECAFLSGVSISTINNTSFTCGATGAIQSSLSLKCNAGEYITFIWMDDDTSIENVIKNRPHQPDCPYLFLDHHSLFKENPADQKENINYREWQNCECKSIIYSPLGHSGDNYDDYKGMADVIMLDSLFPLPYNPNVWIGLDGYSYQTSEDFAWFQLNGSKIEPDVGWGQGKWVAGGIPLSSRNFVFKKGYQYKYLRASLGHDKTYITDGTVPYIIIKHEYNNIQSPLWIRAIADENGQWQSDETITDMVFNPSDNLLYDHIQSNWYCITSIGDFGQSITSDISARNITNNRWINYDFVTSGKTVKLLWPSTLYQNGPSVLSFQLLGIVWGITPPNGSELLFNSTVDSPLEIYVDRIGTWNVNVTGYRDSNNEYYNNIISLTASPILSTSTVSGSNAIKTVYTDTINMSINTPLYGWNYNTNMYDITSNGARPFWAYASDKDDKITKHKGIDIWGGGINIVDDYVLLTQPDFSDIKLNYNTYLEYTAINNLIWKQPLTFNVVVTSNQWCDLIIDTTKMANLSTYLYNIDNEMIVSASNRPSEIVLQPNIDGYNVFINYWAINPFKWVQILTNSTLGLPPTGGVFVPITSGTLVESLYPYLNLTNRHFPTIATVPHVEELYTIEDSGGYFIPRMLGTSTFLSKLNNNILDTSKLLTNYENRGISAVFQNIDTYLTDNGLTQSIQITPVSGVSVDSSWMKASPTDWNNAGTIIESATHQEFLPYQTKYESQKSNNIGIRRQGDNYDPWSGEFDSTWDNSTDWPPDFRKQYNISDWQTQFTTNGKQVYQWKPDIFDNQYALLKILSGQSMYDKKQQIGDLWTRNFRNIVMPASSSLSGLFLDYTFQHNIYPLSSEIFSIKDIDLWYDTIMLKTEHYLIFNKILFDFETGSIDFDINNQHIINLNESNKTIKFGGIWFFEDNKDVTISLLVSTISAIYPELRNLDLDTNDLTYIYNQTSIDTNSLTSLCLTSLEDPVFTYNNETQTYNMAFIGHSSLYESFLLGNIYLTDSGDFHEISKVSVITPLK